MTKLTRRTVLVGAAGVGVAACATGGGATGGGATKEAGTAAGAQAVQKPKPLSILVLGGTGFLGPAIVEAALARGHTLTLFNRGKTRPEKFAHTPGITFLRGNRDPRVDEGLAALEGGTWDAVIDTSGYVPRIVKASAELLAPKVGQYVFISSISVYADLSKPATEASPVATIDDPTNEEVRKNYGALKALCEQAAEAALPGRALTIRPGLIVGTLDPTDRFTYWPVRLARGGEVLAPGDGSDPVQFIDVRDLAEFTVHALEEKLTGVYNATGPAELLTMKRFLDETNAAVGGKAQLVWVPTPFLEEQKVSAWQDMPVWIPASGETASAGRVSVAKAVGKGLRFRSIADTAKATLAYYEALPPERKEAPRAGLPAAREQEVLAAWRAAKARPAATP